MEIEDYFNEVKNIVKASIEFSVDSNRGYNMNPYLETLASNSDKKLLNLLSNIYDLILTEEDIKKYKEYLAIPLLSNLSDEQKISLFYLSNDVYTYTLEIDISEKCVLYDKTLPIFKAEISLFNHIRKKENGDLDLELISYAELQQVDNSEIIKYHQHYFYLDSSLSQYLLNDLYNDFPNSNIFVRLNPYKAFEKQPLRLLEEEVLIPANPDWIKNLELHKNHKQGCSYILQNVTPNISLQKFWDYNVKKIRRLEVIFKRNNNGNLSGMIEEISEIDIEHNILKGLCIHFDTDSPYGTSYKDSILNHLDLAMNYYIGDKTIKDRNNENLANGKKVTNATHRVHLLRIESIPFNSLFKIAINFFKSIVLVTEWINDIKA